MSRRMQCRPRRGNILVLTAFVLVGLMAVVALSVDVGVLSVARNQLQRSADAAAMAACWELIDEGAPARLSERDSMPTTAAAKANEFAGLNRVLNGNPVIAETDIEVGYLSNPSDPNCPLVVGGSEAPNAVHLHVRRTSDLNGGVPLFFARVLGRDAIDMQADATAALLTSIRGFRSPPSDKPLGILPFALDEETCQKMLAGNGGDDWAWDSVNQTVAPGHDRVVEVNLYPQGTGSPGNRGTVDIGKNNNSTKDIARQITQGVSKADLDAMGGKLELVNGVLYLNGDTGISAGVKDELASIIGEPKVIPVFREVKGNGNNAIYTIVDFVGVTVLDVKLTGALSSKRVTIQPTNVVTHSAIASPDNSSLGHFIYSPVWLVR